MYAYRLTNRGAGSDRFGPCECCGKTVDSTYLLVQMKRYVRHDGTEGITYHKCFDAFGHKECLSKLTEVHNVSD